MAVNNDKSRAWLRSTNSSSTFNMSDSSACTVSMWIQLLSFSVASGIPVDLLKLRSGSGNISFSISIYPVTSLTGQLAVFSTNASSGGKKQLLMLSNTFPFVINEEKFTSDWTGIGGTLPTGAVPAAYFDVSTTTGIRRFWFDDGSTIAPAVPGGGSIHSVTLIGTDQGLSDNIVTAMTGSGDADLVGAANSSTVIVTTTLATAGPVDDIIDGAVATGATFSVLEQGVSWINILLSWNSFTGIDGQLYLNVGPIASGSFDSDELISSIQNTDGQFVSSLFAPTTDGDNSGIIGDSGFDLSVLSERSEIFSINWNGVPGSTLPTGAVPGAWFDASSTSATYRFWFFNGSTTPPAVDTEILTAIAFTGAETDQEISDLVVIALLAADGGFASASNSGGTITTVSTTVTPPGPVTNIADGLVSTSASFRVDQQGWGFLGSLNRTGVLGGIWEHLASVEFPNESASVDIHEVYFNNTTNLDFSIEANRRKFITVAGLPENIGANGETPTGSSPVLYLPNAAATYEDNAGTGGDWEKQDVFIDTAAPS